MLNSLSIMGRLVADPDVRRTPAGVSVTNFRIVVDRDYDKEAADFFQCVAWRGTADFVGKYFKKGNRIAIHGSIQNSDWTDKNGEKRTTTEIVAREVYFCESKKSEAAPDGAFYDFGNEDDLPY